MQTDYSTPSGINIKIVEFYSKAVPVMKWDDKLRKDVETGELRTEDWVAYAPPGGLDKAVTHEQIKRLSRVIEPEADASPSMRAPYDRWQVISKAYELWKKGESMPVEGTPLSVWNALRREHVEAFKKHGIATVEEISTLNDAMIGRIQIPNLRELKARAVGFLKANDQNKLAAELKAKDDKIAELAEQISALQRVVIPQTGQTRRGRPPKQEAQPEPGEGEEE